MPAIRMLHSTVLFDHLAMTSEAVVLVRYLRLGTEGLSPDAVGWSTLTDKQMNFKGNYLGHPQ